MSIVQAQSRMLGGGGGGCHSTVKPAKKSFVMVMFQCSVSNLLHNFFCSFPNSFPKVSVVNVVHRQEKGGNVCKSSFGGRMKAQVCRRRLCIISLGPYTKEGLHNLKKC